MQNAHASTDGNGHVRLRRRTTRTRRDCDNLLTRLGHGDITVKPGIQRYGGNLVTFTDGSSVEAVVVYCTGSRISFPFLDERLVSSRDYRVELHRRVVSGGSRWAVLHRAAPTLRAIFPLAEQQSQWVADLITGVCRLPHRR